MSDADVRIHQIYFEPEQKSRLDPSFIPFDNCTNPSPELREFYVFKQAYEQGLHRQAAYTGFWSWKYFQKCAVPGKRFIDFVNKNPGADVYFINPMLHTVLLHKNTWVQGEKCHPGMLELADKIFKGLGYQIDLQHLKMNFSNTLCCNFWVGNEKFWQRYMSMAMAIHDYTMHNLDDRDRQLMFMRADSVRDACYFPFIIERLFSTLLILHPDIQFFSYRYGPLEAVHRYTLLVKEKLTGTF